MHSWPVYQDNFISDTVIGERCHVALWFSMQSVNHIRYQILDVKSVPAKWIWQLHKTSRTPLCIIFLHLNTVLMIPFFFNPQVQHAVGPIWILMLMSSRSKSMNCCATGRKQALLVVIETLIDLLCSRLHIFIIQRAARSWQVHVLLHWESREEQAHSWMLNRKGLWLWKWEEPWSCAVG